VPAGVLTSGHYYYAVITALKTGQNKFLAPFKFSPDDAEAQTLTNKFTP